MAGEKTKTSSPSFANPAKPVCARVAALEVLNRFESSKAYAGDVLEEVLPYTSQRQRTTDIVFGTIRNRSALDIVITKFGNCPPERISRRLLNIIRIGAYELAYSPLTPGYSIVNDAVENAKAVAGAKQTGFVNAVLRQITRHTRNRCTTLSDSGRRKTLPQSLSHGCEFDVDILPSPEQSPENYFSCAFSLPGWLVADWLDEFGLDKTRQICFAGNRRPSIYLRPNTLKTTTAELVEKLRASDTDCEIAGEFAIRVKSPAAVNSLVGFKEGLFSIQDPTAQLAAKLLEPKPGRRMLDLCAAPGTKTMQLAELAEDKAEIVTTDKNARRLEKVGRNIRRLGIRGVKVVAFDAVQGQVEEGGLFDSVLLDVPCSNTGVLAKRVEVRHRLKPGTITGLAVIQSRLLETAAKLIKPDGRICYSTCSIQTSENSGLVKDFLESNPEFRLEREKLTLPSAENFDCDGGYVAIIARQRHLNR